MGKVQRRISGGDLFLLFLRLLLLQGLLHAKGMQNLSIMNALGPILLKLRVGDESDKRLIAKHLNFFNCNPNFVPLVAGGIVSLEERRLSGKAISEQEMDTFKRALSSPLAAMGDMLFLGALKPMALTLACLFAIHKSLIGLLAVILLYNAVIISCRLWGVYFGYAKGWDLVDVFSGPGFQRLLGIVQIAGAGVGGALVAVVVYRLPGGGMWIAGLGAGVMVAAVFLLRKEISSSRFAIFLFPISTVIALLLR